MSSTTVTLQTCLTQHFFFSASSIRRFCSEMTDNMQSNHLNVCFYSSGSLQEERFFGILDEIIKYKSPPLDKWGVEGVVTAGNPGELPKHTVCRIIFNGGWRLSSVLFIPWRGNRIWFVFQGWPMRGSYFAYNGWQMHWPVLGCRGRLGVCLHRLISQTKRVSRPSSCAGSNQTAGRRRWGGGGGAVHLAKQDGPSAWQGV